MKRWVGHSLLCLLGLCTGAEAGALSLAALDRSDLEQMSVSLQDYRQMRRSPARTLAAAPATSDLLVKFRQRGQVRALTVDRAVEAEALARLARRTDVEFVEPNARLYRQAEASDPLIGNQWHHVTIGSSNAWEWGIGSSAVKVAIVDVPFNLSHPDLAGNAVNGWDVVNEVSVISGSDDHASMSAGMAGAVVFNGIGVAGAGNFQLVPVNNAYADLSSDVAQMDAAIRWAADHGIRVVNISWDGAGSATLNLAAKYLRDTVDGIVVMAGVNGSGLLNYTNQPYIVAVSMTDSSDMLQSRYGPHIDFAAPGKLIYSTSALGYATDSGTSFSTPLVSGVFAALFSIHSTLTADEAISILKSTAVDLGTPGWDPSYGWGRVDFGQAAWLAATVGGLVTDLGPQNLETTLSNLVLSTLFHPGVSYELLGSPGLEPVAWTPVAAPMQTNGAVVEFRVEPGADAAFFKIVATPDFE